MIIKPKYRKHKIFQMKKLLSRFALDIDKTKYLDAKDILQCLDVERDIFIQYCEQHDLNYDYKKDKKEGYQ